MSLCCGTAPSLNKSNGKQNLHMKMTDVMKWNKIQQGDILYFFSITE